MTTARTPLVTVALVTVALLAAACGGTGDGDGVSSAGAGSLPADADPSTTSLPGTDRAEDPDAPSGPTTSDDTDENPQLTDSFRGVTVSAIKIGVALLDSRPFVDNGDVASRFRALADQINDQGGILGRRVDLVIDEFDVLDELGFEEVCTRHTEDEKVFAVIAFAFSMDLSCYGGLHDTNVINLIEISEADVAGSTASVLSVAADPLGSLLAGLDLLAEELDGTPVAIHVRPEREADLTEVRNHLEILGAEIVSETVATVYFDDIPADQTQHDIFLERWLTEGAETVVAIGRGASSAAIGTVDRAGSDILVVAQGNEANSLEAFGDDLGRMNLIAIAPTAIDLVAEQGLYGVSGCIEFIESATGQTISIRSPVGDPQPLFSTIGACQGMELLELIATAAGVDLTNETWRAAAEGLGSFELVGTPRASLQPGKVFASDPDVDLYVFDDTAGGFIARG